jgi:oxygen-independent coproporphyrinogen-3 oxidase
MDVFAPLPRDVNFGVLGFKMSAADLVPHFAQIGSDPIRDAFAARRAVMPWRTKRPLPEEEVPATWLHLMSGHHSPERRLVYIHVPFCANHCLFCGFYRNAYTPAAAASYADLIVEEIEREATAPTITNQLVEAVYLGGGTPSALTPEALSRILLTVKRCLPLAPDCEITIEGRIVHFDPDKIDASLEAGVNRISIGVQSFDTAVRRRQGRRTSKEEAIRFLEAIRDRDCATLVIDLLYGLPGQTDHVWREDLRIASEIAPDGVDLYGLNLIPGTPLHKAMQAGKFPGAATLKDIGSMYRAGAEFLTAAGWVQISNSHWARTPRERNVYNLRIKEGADCLAYGSGAGGMLGRYSYAVSGDLGSYRQSMLAGRKPIDGMRFSDALQPVRNVITAGLETGRLDLDRIAAPFADTLGARIAPLLEQWCSAGLITIAGNVVSLTTAGRFWYSNLVAAFDAILPAVAPAAIANLSANDPPSVGSSKGDHIRHD